MVTHLAAYDEIAAFIASMDPLKLVQFHASEALQNRIDFLLDKNSESGLTPDENSELEHYLVIDHLISLAKVRAQKIINQSVAMPS